MCVIIIADKKNPPMSLLKKAEQHNSDGAGLAWIENGSVKWIKGRNLTAKEIKQFIKSHKVKVPYIIHFRIGTVGSKCDELSHPFPLTKGNKNKKVGLDYEGVLFHNGHYDKWQSDLKIVYSGFREIIPDEKMSDSRAMSLIASKSKLGLGYLQTITSQKIAIITPKGIKRYGSDWAKVEKITCSNDYFDWSYTSCENDNINDTNFENEMDMYDDDQYCKVIDNTKGITTYEKKDKKRDRSLNYVSKSAIKDQENLCQNLEVHSSKLSKKTCDENCLCKECIEEAENESFDHIINCSCVNCEKIEKSVKIFNKKRIMVKGKQLHISLKKYKKSLKKLICRKKTQSNMIKARIIENDKKLIDETNKEYEIDEYEKEYDILAQKRKDAFDEIEDLWELKARNFDESEGVYP